MVANIDCLVLSDSSEANYHEVRRWRDIDADAFADDLSRTELVLSPPDDVAEAFACYDQTLRTLLDKHAPLQRRRVRTRPSARWYDSECHNAKRQT